MKRLSILITMLILTVAFLLFAQDAAQTGEQTTQNQGENGNNFVTEAITNYLIDDFEFANTCVFFCCVCLLVITCCFFSCNIFFVVSISFF